MSNSNESVIICGEGFPPMFREVTSEERQKRIDDAWEKSGVSDKFGSFKVIDVSEDDALKNTITLVFDEETGTYECKCGVPGYMEALHNGEAKWSSISTLYGLFHGIIKCSTEE